MDWTYIRYISELPNSKAIHCDTRDFHVIFVDSIETKPARKIVNLQYKSEEYLISKSEILEFLKNLEDISGGKGEWRFLHFNNIQDNSGWDHKYLRFYRYPINPDKYIVCNAYNKIIKWKDLNESNIDKEHLSTH